MSWHVVAAVEDLEPGQVIAVDVGELELVLGLDDDARYFAMERTCAHNAGDLSYGGIADGHLVCPLHGWRYAIATGRHDASPACLRTYAVRVTGDQIEIATTPTTR